MIGHLIIWVLFFFLLWAAVNTKGTLHQVTVFAFFVSVIGVIISCYALAAKLFLLLIGY